MSLRLYNTLTRTKEPFAPLDPKNVRLYVCGPTVYDFAHIGNARPVIVFDVLFRLLRHLYGETHVTYVRNITDIDDKINARAKERLGDRNVPILDVVRELTVETARIYDEDVAALGCLAPTEEPRATKHVPQMIAMIETLVANGHAYAVEGHVLFDVSSKPDYGKLSRRSLDEMMAGARVEVAPYKRNAMDFVLWKPSDAETPGWDSPWGRGRPGWHIECSAMSAQYLGETFDIHGGGIDLMFPHHENEIAQSESAHHNHPLANVWMHNGFLNVEGEKMSKSLGNFVTIRELLRGWNGHAWTGGVIRWAMLQTHYRDPVDWTHEGLLAAAAEVAAIAAACDPQNFRDEKEYDALWKEKPLPTEGMLEALRDDLNIPQAMKVIRAQLKALNVGNVAGRAELLNDVRFLGLFERSTIRSYRASVGISGTGIPPEVVAPASANLRLLQVFQANNDVGPANQVREDLKVQGIRVGDETYGVFTSGYSPPASVFRSDVSGPSIEELIEARNAARAAKDFKESDRIRDELAAKGIVLKDGPSGTTWEVKR
jgi:cysteinyl-tRNA synthetase